MQGDSSEMQEETSALQEDARKLQSEVSRLHKSEPCTQFPCCHSCIHLFMKSVANEVLFTYDITHHHHINCRIAWFDKRNCRSRPC